MAVDVRRFPWIRKLAADYAFEFESLAPFFAGNPSRPEAWADAIGRSHARTDRPTEIAAIVAAQQERRHAPGAARLSAQRLCDARAVAVVTGQQAGFLGGPLFTLLKALTALKLAETVAREHGVPAVAVFWVDAEDHDWDEVRSVTVLDAELAPRIVSLPARSGAEVGSISGTRLEPSVGAALDEVGAFLPPTAFREALIADLHTAYAPGVGMAEAFARWLERVLGDRGLVVFDASDSAAKPLVRDLFVRELSSPGETSRLAAAAGRDLVALGYHAQVQPVEDAVALFHLGAGRQPIRRQGEDFFVGDVRYSGAELVEIGRDRPALFSPNVLLRPVVQDTLFPTICYVAGPNELAYLGQLRRIYDRFALPMPLMYPRASATIVDSACLRFLRRYDLSIEALESQDESALNRLLSAQIPAAVDESFTAAYDAISTRMAALAAVLPALDPTLVGAADSTLGRMQHDLTTLRGKMIQAAKRRDDTLRRQFLRARALTFPGGHAQERTVGFVSFLNQYGHALIERLDAQLPLDLGHHWVVAV